VHLPAHELLLLLLRGRRGVLPHCRSSGSGGRAGMLLLLALRHHPQP
jgi:hypothetical protein